jgi:hypothetical protein
MATVYDTNERRGQQRIQTTHTAATDSKISAEVLANRRKEIYEYLKLFGYKEDKTIIQVHLTGFFKKRKPNQIERERHAASLKRYGGSSFVIVGRTHDPSIIEKVLKPKRKNPLDLSPGYIGYLWKNKDIQKRAPHELIPLDFTPIHLPYPSDWKNMFATKGFMLGLHVPSSFVKDKNKLTRALYSISKGGLVDVKNHWTFLKDLSKFGFNSKAGGNTTSEESNTININHGDYSKNMISHTTKGTSTPLHADNPLALLKKRLGKQEISNEDFEKLRKTVKT